MDRGDAIGMVAMKLVQANIGGDSFEAVFAHVQQDAALARFAPAINTAHAEWQSARPKNMRGKDSSG
jgi:hypothetical protein